MSYLKEK